MAKTSTYNTLNPVHYTTRVPITAQRIGALNKMATWVQAEKKTTYVGLYAGASTLDGSYECLNWVTPSAGSTTWVEMARFHLYIDADDNATLQWNVACDVTETPDGYANRGEIRLVIVSGATLDTYRPTADGWSGYRSLAGCTGGAWNYIKLEARYTDAAAPGGGNSYQLNYIYGLTINAARLTGSYPDVL